MRKLHIVTPDAPSPPSLEDLALEAARAAPADFCSDDYQQWAWPWRFARRLRALPDLADDKQAFSFRAVFMEFCRHAALREEQGEAPLSDSFFDREQWDDRFAEFLAAWEAIRVPEGYGPLELAFAHARRRGIIPTEAPSMAYILVVSTAYYLQVERGAGVPFFLPATRLSRLIKKTERHASWLVRLAETRGLLRIVDGDYSYTKHKARTYTFNLDGQGVTWRLPEARRGSR